MLFHGGIVEHVNYLRCDLPEILGVETIPWQNLAQKFDRGHENVKTASPFPDDSGLGPKLRDSILVKTELAAHACMLHTLLVATERSIVHALLVSTERRNENALLFCLTEGETEKRNTFVLFLQNFFD